MRGESDCPAVRKIFLLDMLGQCHRSEDFLEGLVCLDIATRNGLDLRPEARVKEPKNDRMCEEQACFVIVDCCLVIVNEASTL